MIWRTTSTILAGVVTFAVGCALAVFLSTGVAFAFEWLYPEPGCTAQHTYYGLCDVAGKLSLGIGLVAAGVVAVTAAAFRWDDWGSGRQARERNYATVWRERDEARTEVARLKASLPAPLATASGPGPQPETKPEAFTEGKRHIEVE